MHLNRLKVWLAAALLLPTLVIAKPLLVIISAEPEYKTAESLPKFCEQGLKGEFEVVLVTASKDNPHVLSENWIFVAFPFISSCLRR